MIVYHIKFDDITFRIASYERVPCIVFRTTAYRIMIQNLTLRCYTACSYTWVSTFLVCTCFSTNAIRTNYTLRSACRWLSNISRNARAYRLLINFPTLTIRSTRRRVARI